jgi:tRNA threonylcarbamoyladenosine biosynthesis protein TsaE
VSEVDGAGGGFLFCERTTRAAAETELLGQALGRALLEPEDRAGTAAVRGAGTWWLLIGEMGAGKTAFVHGVARGLGARGRIRSPGFTLVTTHAGRLPIVHVDLYRIEDPALVEGLGLAEVTAPGSVVFIEWGERARGAVDPDHFEIAIEDRGGDDRVLRMTASGARSVVLGRALAPALAAPLAPAGGAALDRAAAAETRGAC